MTRRRMALGAALLLELTILAFSGARIRQSSEDFYWWLWSVAPLPDGVDRPHRLL